MRYSVVVGDSYDWHRPARAVTVELERMPGGETERLRRVRRAARLLCREGEDVLEFRRLEE